MGVAQFPENGTGNLTQHNLDIFDASKNADAAFEYIAYCTGLDNAKRVIWSSRRSRRARSPGATRRC